MIGLDAITHIMERSAPAGQYGLKDLAAPFIQFRGTLGDCVREAKGLGLCSIHRWTQHGWKLVAARYFDDNEFTHARNIREVTP